MDFKLEIAGLLAAHSGIEVGEIAMSLETPPDKALGDFAFPCFKLAKSLKKTPQVIAAEMLVKLSSVEFLERIENNGPYLNFFVNRAFFVESEIGKVISEQERFAAARSFEGQTVVIDYGSPNIAKSLHVGNLRSTVIGNSLYRIYRYLGYNTIGVNHLGDWGTQFGKLIAAYFRFSSKERVDERGILELDDIYVRFTRESKEDSGLVNEARKWFVKMEENDPQAISIWQWFLSISKRHTDDVFEKLDVKHEYDTGESFYTDKMPAVIEELKEKNMLVESDGAMIVDLSEYKMPPCLILRSDGGTLYPTRDIACALYRKSTFNFNKSLYLTDAGQALHFAQWFKVVELMGYEWANNMHHIPFGVILSSDGKRFKTRSGDTVKLLDLMDEAVARTLTIIEEKNPGLPDKHTIANQVGVGALKFNELYNGRIKDSLFDWEKVLNFEGETGPYVQYTHARASSVWERAGIDTSALANVDYKLAADDTTFEIARLISVFGDKVIEAAEKFEPYILSRHLVDLAQAFNRFYHENPVLSAEENIKFARLAIVFAVKTAIALGLELLGIASPQRM